MSESLNPYLTAKEAGLFLGYANGVYIAKLCREDSTRPAGAYKAGNTWMIPREWVERRKTEDVAAGIVRDGTPGRKATTGTGLNRKRPAYVPKGTTPGRPRKDHQN